MRVSTDKHSHNEDRMPSSVSRLFSDADRARIQAAVHDAEGKTSGEIVPFVVERSDAYEAADWRGGALLGIAAASATAAVHELTDIWLPFDLAGLVLIMIACFVAGMLAVRFIPALKRLLTGNDEMGHHVGRRAAEAFVAEEVFKTRDRTGILLFVSLLERRVLVVGDAGINARVQKSDWDGIVATIVEGLKTGAPTEGLVRAIGACGDLLERHGVARKIDDTDELSDGLRMSDR
jgi:putative membrane protein